MSQTRLHIDVFCNFFYIILDIMPLCAYNNMIFFAMNYNLLRAKVRTKWDNDKYLSDFYSFLIMYFW